MTLDMNIHVLRIYKLDMWREQHKVVQSISVDEVLFQAWQDSSQCNFCFNQIIVNVWNL